MVSYGSPLVLTSPNYLLGKITPLKKEKILKFITKNKKIKNQINYSFSFFGEVDKNYLEKKYVL